VGKKEAVTMLSGLLIHTNVQTFPADASNEIAESINTPGVTQGGLARQACMIERMFVDSNGVNPGPFGATAETVLVSQLQFGNRAAVPAILDRDSPFLFTSGSLFRTFVTTGGDSFQMPVEHPILAPVPIIVHDEMTFAHVAVNNAAWNNRDVVTIIHYRVVEIRDMSLYQALLLQQTRTS